MGETETEKLLHENTRLKEQQDELSYDLHEEREMVKYLHGVIKNYEVLLRKGSKRVNVSTPKIIKQSSIEEILRFGGAGGRKTEDCDPTCAAMENGKRKPAKERKDVMGFLKHVRSAKSKRKASKKESATERAADKTTTCNIMTGVKQQTQSGKAKDISPSLGKHSRESKELSILRGSRHKDLISGEEINEIATGCLKRNLHLSREIREGKVTRKECKDFVGDDQEDDLFLCDSNATQSGASCHSLYGRYTNKNEKFGYANEVPKNVIPYHDIVTDTMEEISEIPEVSTIDRENSVRINVMDLIEQSWEQMEKACDTEEDNTSMRDIEAFPDNAILSRSRESSNASDYSGRMEMLRLKKERHVRKREHHKGKGETKSGKQTKHPHALKGNNKINAAVNKPDFMHDSRAKNTLQEDVMSHEGSLTIEPFPEEIEEYCYGDEAVSDVSTSHGSILELNLLLDNMFLKLSKAKQYLEGHDKALTRMESKVEYLESFALGEESECL